ncbi:MAG TPA: cytochrome c nitrite reductase small subunit [Longimicrobiales bacterium]|nr:cytochrome c nitrite reductase small subunit [Longimicrobiales bacterium]
MRRWLFPVTAVLLGVAIGLAAFTFVYAKGHSYLGSDPAACANCHIMDDHYDAWAKSSHRAVAGCNDCHTPHATLPKYYVKAKNGFWHSVYFTTGTFPDPIRITGPNRDVVQEACRYCHAPITESIDHGVPAGNDQSAEPLDCTRCHRHVGHWLR